MMDTEISDLPLAIIDDIVSRVDLLTIPCFKATCQLIDKQITTKCYNKLVAQKVKKQLSSIIHVVQNYDKALSSKDIVEKVFRTLFVKLFSRERNEYLPFSKKLVIIKYMMAHVRNETNASMDRIKETWINYNCERPLTEDNITILESFKRFIIGTQSIYIVSYNYIDKYTKNKSFYCVLNLQYLDDGSIHLGLSIQDVDPYRKVYGTRLEEKTMEIIVNDTTLEELSEFIVDTIGTRLCLSEVEIVNSIDKWIGYLTKYGESLYDDAINSLVNPLSYRNQIKDILSTYH